MYERLLNCNAKINIGLNILEKRKDGYHDIDSIFLPISLSDTMRIKFFTEKGKLKISSNWKEIPLENKNIIYKLYKEFFRKSCLCEKKIEVNLEKKIPIFSGLGGGSSNGAFFLKELNKFHNNYFSREELVEISKKIGADIPFFIYNKAARVQGIGDKIRFIKNNFKAEIILIKPNFGVSTVQAYQDFSKLKKINYANLDNIEKAINDNNLKYIDGNIKNVLEQSLFENDQIIEFKKKLAYLVENKNFYMSGSGSCFYTFCEKEEVNSILLKLQKEINGFFIKHCKLI